MTDTFWSCCWYEDISKGLETVSLLCDSITFLRQCGQAIRYGGHSENFKCWKEEHWIYYLL